MVRTQYFAAVAWVQSLVGELRSCKQSSKVKKTKNDLVLSYSMSDFETRQPSPFLKRASKLVQFTLAMVEMRYQKWQ